MSRWRIVVVLLLLLLPTAALAALGSVWLWERNWGFIAWWPMAASMMLSYLLGWYWQRKRRLLHPVDFTPSMHWTDRDKKAWEMVENRAKAAEETDPARFIDINYYRQTAEEMALEIAQFYHGNAKDYFGQLTVPEVLAVVELASHDLAEMVDKYVPGGHLLTINDWKRAKQALDWAPTAQNAYWVVSAIFSPLNTALRYVASRAGLSGAFQMLQQNLQLWFYTAFVHRLGTYLIELNSGRLKVGATRYRELLQQLEPLPTEGEPPRGRPPELKAEPAADGKTEPPPAAEEPERRVTVTLFGQVKAGKSSLVNAILGEQRAKADVLPATAEISRYELHPEGVPARLVFLDTVGYGHAGPKADQLKATQNVVHESDLLLMVLHARSPGRQADLTMLQHLRKWLDERPDLKRPPVVAVLTHIDLLSPALEWAPPYNWRQPTRLKEQQIQQAVAAVQEQLGDYLDGVVPVCTAAGRVYGVEEELLPIVTTKVNEAQAVALLRCLKAEMDATRVRKVFDQLLSAGKEAVKIAWSAMRK
jgi:hypothetical protein